METTKNESNVKVVLPFSYFLWMFGMNPDALNEETALHKPQAEQEYTNEENINYEEEK